MDAGDSDIAYYNQIVKSDIYFLGHPAIQKYRNGFKALVSTEEVDARDNTETTGTGVPIYWLNGRKIYDNYIDLYDGNDPYNTSLGTKHEREPCRLSPQNLYLDWQQGERH